MSNSEDPFLVFIASTDMSIYVFDAANKGAAEVLRRAGRITLGMLVETAELSGPFVTFWQKEDEGWRIQMVGAVRP